MVLVVIHSFFAVVFVIIVVITDFAWFSMVISRYCMVSVVITWLSVVITVGRGV